MQDPRKNLSSLGLSDSEVTVYLSMISGVLTARDLVKVTRMKRPTVYYALGCLQKRGLVSRTGTLGDNKLALESLDRLSTIVDEKALEIYGLQKSIGEMIPALQSERMPADQKPVVAFYEGVDAVKSVIMEMLYCRNKRINSVVPQNNFFWQVGPDFVQTFIKERIRREIKTNNLWEAPINKGLIKQYYESLSQVRILPEVMHGKFATTTFLYDDRTLHVSSKKNSYAVLIASKEHTDTMRAWFDGLWSVSKPHAK